MIRGNIKTFARMVVRRDDSAIGRAMSLQMHAPATESTDRTVDRVSITLLVDTDAFPPIFLVVELHGSALGRENEVRRGITWEAA